LIILFSHGWLRRGVIKAALSQLITNIETQRHPFSNMILENISKLFNGKRAGVCLVFLGCLAIAQANVSGNPSWYTPPHNWEYDNEYAPPKSIGGSSASESQSQSSNEEVVFLKLLVCVCVYVFFLTHQANSSNVFSHYI